ncbi:hypothetical protein HMPREF0682_2746 [Propionibacterium acidifaciens F0233]|uniref:Uncharacterized protein n=1 Tax=Propionibacterium acidifaciens F0233 TaxID=553198 RepID=U2PXF6_9ACTN|nr:hypothetical protein HMPREF0682_2746 [Propionibacterium acidifaciens F0233]
MLSVLLVSKVFTIDSPRAADRAIEMVSDRGTPIGDGGPTGHESWCDPRTARIT